jgi:hypothetical protein
MLVLGAAALTAVTAMTMTATGAFAAVRPFGPEQTLAGGCGTGLGDALVTADGSVRGFVDCLTPSGPQIRFVSRRADGTVNPSEQTGLSGTVLGMAYDSTATYVLLYTDLSIVIAKRTNAGAYSARAVDSWSGVVPPTGDVIAAGGQWLGVWSKQVGPGGEFAQTDLFQGGSTTATHRITTDPADDTEPSLAYSGSIPVLVWSRQQAPAVPGPADLRVAKLISGRWESRLFASSGERNYSPDIRITGGQTFVAWGRDGVVVVASNVSGSFTSHTFATPGANPRVAAATASGLVTGVFVAWNRPVDGNNRVFFAETVGSGGSVVTTRWNGAFLTDVGFAVVGTGATGDNATVVYRSFTTVYSRSQT